jgi:hypothetical protein
VRDVADEISPDGFGLALAGYILKERQRAAGQRRVSSVATACRKRRWLEGECVISIASC